MPRRSAVHWSDAVVVSLLPLTVLLVAHEFEGAMVLLAVLFGLLVATAWYVDFWFRSYLDGEPSEPDRRPANPD